jgi:SAM-dependent methyltransferase
MKISSLERWKIAQKSEEEFWEKFTTESFLKELKKMYEEKAEFLLKQWEKFTPLSKKIKILEIGCGPQGVINFLPLGNKYSIDPLADFYKERFNFDYKLSHLQKGIGENLPFKDESFDVIILMNILDHSEKPEKVLSEIKRVLKPNGILHFENYFYQEGFIYLSKLFGKFKEFFIKEIFNIHHPYMFLRKDLKLLLSKDFSILYEAVGKDPGEDENFSELKKKRKKSKRLTVKIPALFGLYGTINYISICKKRL